MEIIGRELEVGFAAEATRGTAESSASKWQRNTSATVLERAEMADDDATRGKFEDMDGRRVVQRYSEGSIEGIVHVDEIGYVIGSLYGQVASSVVSGSVYDHAFTLAQNNVHPSLTVFAKDGGAQQVKIPNAMVSTFELTAAVDDFVRFTTEIVGSVAESDSTTPSYTTGYDFIGCDIVVKVADTEGGLTGATATKVKDATITWDQGLIRDHVFGSCSPDDIYNAKSMIEGEFTLNFTDETFKDLYLGDDAKYMSITITGEADLGGGENPTITLVLNKVQFNDWSRDGASDELVTQTVSFKAYYNESDDKASTLTLRNLTSAYTNIPTV